MRLGNWTLFPLLSTHVSCSFNSTLWNNSYKRTINYITSVKILVSREIGDVNVSRRVPRFSREQPRGFPKYLNTASAQIRAQSSTHARDPRTSPNASPESTLEMISDEARRAPAGRCFFFYYYFSSASRTSSPLSLSLPLFSDILLFSVIENHWYSASDRTCRENFWWCDIRNSCKLEVNAFISGWKMIDTMCSW